MSFQKRNLKNTLMLKVKVESWQKLPSELKALKVWTKSLKNVLVAEWKMTSSMYLQWTTSSHRLKQREHYRYFCKLILQKSLEAGRRSLGSQGARAPPIFGKSPNCQNKSRNLWDAEMFDHAMKLQGSLDLLRASRPDWRIQKLHL